MKDIKDEIVKAAQIYRASQQLPPGGVVLLWDGVAYGWKNKLRDPGHERPGALAVDEDGNVFEAQGGDECRGAQVWGGVFFVLG